MTVRTDARDKTRPAYVPSEKNLLELRRVSTLVDRCNWIQIALLVVQFAAAVALGLLTVQQFSPDWRFAPPEAALLPLLALALLNFGAHWMVRKVVEHNIAKIRRMRLDWEAGVL